MASIKNAMESWYDLALHCGGTKKGGPGKDEEEVGQGLGEGGWFQGVVVVLHFYPTLVDDGGGTRSLFFYPSPP